jgi:hypothetical protein
MGKYRSKWDIAPKPTKVQIDFLSIDGLSLSQINKLSVLEYQERANQFQTKKRQQKKAK